MRSGKILAENSPDYLLNYYKESVGFLRSLNQFALRLNLEIFFCLKNLENVFLKLCIKDEIKTSPDINNNNNNNNNNLSIKNPNYDKTLSVLSHHDRNAVNFK
jgi:hypothetical protein